MTRRPPHARKFGIYVAAGPGLYEVFHPDDPERRIGTVLHASDDRWYFDALDGDGFSRGYATREDACRGLRGVIDQVSA